MLMDYAMAGRDILPPKRAGRAHCSHLLFADDILVFCKEDEKYFRGLDSLLEVFHRFTGLEVNMGKSKIFLSRGVRGHASLSDILGISTSSGSLRYMGFPLDTAYPKAKAYAPLIDRCRERISGWASRLLSTAGRIELVQSVVHSFLIYWGQCFWVPPSVLRTIDRLCRDFIWGSHMHIWAWGDMCIPKKEGGIGLRNLHDLLAASGVKLLWRYLDSAAPWVPILRSSYQAGALSIFQCSPRLTDSGTWKFLLRSRVAGSLCIRREVGDGRETSVRWDPWLPCGPLASFFPPPLDEHDLRVSQIWDGTGWRLPPHLSPLPLTFRGHPRARL